MEVILTFDTEIWCKGWNNIDEQFIGAFNSYIYGTTNDGDYGLPYTLKILKKYGLPATFFVEPLFASRFGIDPLQEIVEMILEYGQDIQLHLHTEWIDEISKPILNNISKKKRYIKHFSLGEQKIIIKEGIELLKKAGCLDIKAFRAGGFGANNFTLKALKHNKILIDSSYNPCLFDEIDIHPEKILTQPILIDGVYEYPMTVYKDGLGKIKHLQISACSFREMKDFLWKALDNGWIHVNILSHNFELINLSKQKKDKVVLNRFHDLCNFLHKHNKIFKCTTFQDIQPFSTTKQFEIISVNPIYTYQRLWRNTIRRIKRL